MKTIFTLILTIFILTGCALNSEQEGKLYKEMTLYINAHNDCKILARVALTHPLYVAEIKNQGDSIFLKKFQCQNDHISKKNQIIDPLMKGSKSKGDVIEVKFQANYKDNPITLYAISTNKGKKWHFLKEDEYQDLKEISTEFKPLF